MGHLVLDPSVIHFRYFNYVAQTISLSTAIIEVMANAITVEQEEGTPWVPKPKPTASWGQVTKPTDIWTQVPKPPGSWS